MRFVVQALACSALIFSTRVVRPTIRRLKPELQTFACLALIAFTGCDKKSPAPASPATSTTASSATTDESDPSKTLDRLTQAVRKYAAETRSTPKSLNDLVAAGYLPEMPEAPAGKKFVIDGNLRVQLQ